MTNYSQTTHGSFRFIPTKVHGIFDYAGAVFLLFLPEILGFSNVGGAAAGIPRVIGLFILVQSLFTDYEVGVVRLLPMRTHLINDYIASIFLALSPWIFGINIFASSIWLPHVIIGIAILALSLLTQEEPVETGHPHARPI